MKKRICASTLALLFLGIYSARGADVFLGNGDEDNVGEVKVVELGAEPVTLYDGASATDKPRAYYDYATGVCFKAEPGATITLTFDEFDVRNVNVLLYDTQVNSIQYEYDDWDYTYSYTTPSGWKANYYSSKLPTESFVSETGYLTVIWKPANDNVSGNGIKATVTAESPGDMELRGVQLLNASQKLYAGQLDAPLYCLQINTAKSDNPLSINSLQYDAEAMGTGVGNVRVCTKTDGVFTPVAAEGFTLASGRNEFYFIGDITADATSVEPVTISQLTIGGNQTEISADGATSLAVSSDLIMPGDKSWPVVSIGSDRNFYDNGGQADKIPVGSEGTITFVPADPSKKIKVAFSDFAIFKASIAGNSDIFQVYNGRAATGTPIYTGTGNPGTVKSTADDGSLTIYFKAKATSTYTAGAGWSATVSQFVEAPMVFSSVTGEAAGAAEITECQTDANAGYLNVITTNALNPLKLNGVRVNAPSDKTVKVRLYNLGTKKDAAQIKESNMIGESTPGSGDTDIAADLTLNEGDNWFAVTFDAASGLSDGETVSLAINGATVADEYHALDTPVNASATVSNVCQATEDTHEHTISTIWQYSHQPHSTYSDRYDSGTSDRTVTFRPAHAEGKIEVEFSDFLIYYASQSYGTRAKFEIRNGDRNGAVLWKADSKEKAESGPDAAIRSTAENGALTLIFNPNTYTSGYLQKGFHAQVREVVSKPQTLKTPVITQSNPGVTGLAPASAGHRLLDINLLTDGNLNPLTLSGIKLQLTGETALKKVHLLSSGNSKNFDTATEVGVAESPLSQELTIPCTVTLGDNNNYLWLTVDAADEFDSDIIVDAAVKALKFSNDTEINVENGDPEGNSITQNIYLLESGVNTVTVARTLQFYDDGGPNKNISMNFNGTVTFVPAREGEAVRLDTPEDGFGLGAHKFTVYNGREISDDTKIDTYMGLHGPEDVISTAADGSLTVVVKTSSTPSVEGFHVEVSTYKLQAREVGDAVAVAVPGEFVMRGAKATPLAGMSFDVTGQTGSVALNSATATATTAEGTISNPALYLTTTPQFATDNLIATGDTGTDNTITFTTEPAYEISESGTYYLWLAADIAIDAAVGTEISSAFTSATFSGVEKTVPQQASVLKVHSGIAGTFTIGEGGDFATFAKATEALEQGVEGPVTFNILDGTYHENIVIRNLQGSSAENPVTFRSASGNRAKVIVTGSMPNADNDLYGTHKEGMVLLDHSSHVAFSGITFQPTQGMRYPSVLNVYNNSDFVSVTDCAFSAERYFEEDRPGIKLIYLESPFEPGLTCDNFTVKGSSFNGGYTALSLQGSGYVDHPRCQNVTVEGNTISGQYWQGIYGNGIDNLVIKGNTIENFSMGKSDFRGIDLFQTSFRLEGNRITVASTEESVRGINVRKGTNAKADAPSLIINNAIALPQANAPFHHGIDLDASLKNISLLHNTVLVNGTEGYTIGIESAAASSEGMRFESNLLVNNTGKAAIYSGSAEDIDIVYNKGKWLNNCFYGTAVDSSTGYSSEQYSAKSGDTGVMFGQVSLASATNLRPVTDSELLHAARIDDVTIDADGNQRAAVTSRGAYEYRALSTESPVMAEGYPVVKGATVNSVTVAVKWNVDGSLYSVALPSAQTAPSAAEIMSGIPSEITGGTEISVTKEYLRSETEYCMYFLLSTPLGGNSEVIASAPMTTSKEMPKLEVTSPADVTIEKGASATLSVSVAGGDDSKGYTYQWYDQMMEPAGSDATLTVTPEVSSLYRVKVTSADNQTVWGKARVRVSGTPLAVATFDDVYLADEDSWRWDKYVESNGNTDRFFSGSVEFVNCDLRDYNTWGGFGYANLTSSEYTGLEDQMKNATGSGAENTQAYGVLTPFGLSAYTAELTNSTEGETVEGLYVTNSALTLASILGTDGISTPFAEGDYLEMAIAGYDAAGKCTGHVRMLLADFRAGKQDVVTEWTYLPLKELGQVKSLEFTTTCTNANLNTILCIDQLGARNPDGDALDNLLGGEISMRLVGGDILAVSGVTRPGILSIYTSAGAVALQTKVDADTAVALNRLSAGVYIARFGDATLRFAIK